MVGGQIMDMLAQGQDVDLSQIEQIHRLKTGALLEASVVVGGMVGGGSASQIAALSAYGRNIGLAFQIADDILDISGDTVKLGKSIGSDVRMNKATYPSAIGIEKSRILAGRVSIDAIEAISSFDQKAESLRLIGRFIVEREM